MTTSVPLNFGGLDTQFTLYQTAQIAILPVPFEQTTTWLKGTSRGPKAIIEASQNMELYDIETDSEVYRNGIVTLDQILASDSHQMLARVKGKAETLLRDGKFVVTVGGEHSVSLGAIEAHAAYFRDMNVLHLDAHTDMRDSYKGDKYNHACVMARVREIVPHIISAGIRSMDHSEKHSIDNNNIFYASNIHKESEWIQPVLNRLSDQVYITLDLDVFDPGIMPSTGTPEPGGLGWYQIISLLRELSNQKTIVGCDIVELCPSDNKAPDFLAAKLIYKLLSYRFSSTP